MNILTIKARRRFLLPAAVVIASTPLGLFLDDDATVAAPPAATARYEVTFVPNWNPATHSLEYPLSHAKHGLLTPIIGATHNDRFAIFTPGTRPTPGLERLSEMGKHDPLDAEIKASIRAGKAGSLIQFSDGSPGPVHPSVSAVFDISTDNSMVSLVGMIAPSPDWFYGVSSVQLCEDGVWAPSLAVKAYAWDSGGDRGTTYLAGDMDLNPKQATKKADNPHFAQDGQYSPVGFFLFKLVPQA